MSFFEVTSGWQWGHILCRALWLALACDVCTTVKSSCLHKRAVQQTVCWSSYKLTPRTEQWTDQHKGSSCLFFFMERVYSYNPRTRTWHKGCSTDIQNCQAPVQMYHSSVVVANWRSKRVHKNIMSHTATSQKMKWFGPQSSEATQFTRYLSSKDSPH